MDEYHLTIGAHLLLWGFPLGLTLAVAFSAIRHAMRNEDSP